jgi:hypothetical protein
MNNSILKKIAHLAYQIAGCSLSTPEKPKPCLDKLVEIFDLLTISGRLKGGPLN